MRDSLKSYSIVFLHLKLYIFGLVKKTLARFPRVFRVTAARCLHKLAYDSREQISRINKRLIVDSLLCCQQPQGSNRSNSKNIAVLIYIPFFKVVFLKLIINVLFFYHLSRARNSSWNDNWHAYFCPAPKTSAFSNLQGSSCCCRCWLASGQKTI